MLVLLAAVGGTLVIVQVHVVHVEEGVAVLIRVGGLWIVHCLGVVYVESIILERGSPGAHEEFDLFFKFANSGLQVLILKFQLTDLLLISRSIFLQTFHLIYRDLEHLFHKHGILGVFSYRGLSNNIILFAACIAGKLLLLSHSSLQIMIHLKVFINLLVGRNIRRLFIIELFERETLVFFGCRFCLRIII